MNRVVLIGLFAAAGLAVAAATVYTVIGFGDVDQSKTAGKDSKRDQKKEAKSLKIAKEVCKIMPPNAVILAPKRVSRQLTSLPNCPTPLFVDTMSQEMPDTDKEKRRALVRHIEFKADLSFVDTGAFVDDLRRYRVRAIVMSQEGIRNQRVKEILRQTGFLKVKMTENNHIWIQKVSWREVDERDRNQAEQVCRHVPRGSYVLAPMGVSAKLQAIGCCRPFLHDLPEAFANPGFERRRELLEDVLSVDKDFLKVESAILSEVLESKLISGVVLIQEGDGNKQLKDELRRFNFKMATKNDYYRLWITKDASSN